jgi:hypothetical protein
MSNFIILFLHVFFFANFFIVFVEAKIGSIQKKPKKVTANAAKVGEAFSDEGDDNNAFAADSKEDDSDSKMLSDAMLADQLDEVAKVLPLFANYLVVRSFSEPRAAFSLSVKAAKDRVKRLSAAEKNRLFLQNCPADVRAQLSSKLQYLTDQLNDRQLEDVAQKFTSLSAAKFLCNKMDQPKLAKFVELLPKQKKEKSAKQISMPEQANSKASDELPTKKKNKKAAASSSSKTETNIHTKHVHQDTDIETGSGDL